MNQNKEELECVLTSDNHRAIRNKGGLICTFIKPFKYDGQEERYKKELKEIEAYQLAMAAAPEMLECLEEAIESSYLEMSKVSKKWEDAVKKAKL